MALRYWVGGTGTWSDTGRWSTSSGGGSGASVPAANDTAIIDANSGSPGFIITVSSTAAVGTLYAQSNKTCSIQLNADLVFGTTSYSAALQTDNAVTYTGTGAITTASNAQSFAIVATNTIPALTFNTTSGNISLSQTVNVNNTFTWSSGTLSVNTYNIAADNFVLSGSGTKNFSTSGGKIQVNGVNKTVATTTGASGLTGNSIGRIAVELTGGGSLTTSTTRTVLCTTEYVSISVASGSNVDNIAVTNTSTYARIGNVDLTNHNGGINFSNSGFGVNVFGTVLTLPSTATYISASVYLPLTTNGTTITTGGQAMSLQFYYGHTNGAPVSTFNSATLASNLVLNNASYLGGGALNLAGYTLTSPDFSVVGVYSHAIQYNGGTLKTRVFSYPSSVALSASSAAGTIDFYGSIPNTFAPGPSSNPGFGNVTLKLSGSGTLTISGGNVTIFRLWASYQNNTIYFAPSVFHYITNFDVSGSGSTPVYLFSSTGGVQWYLYNTGTVNLGNVRLKDASTSGGGSFNATSSQDLGNVFGWNFIVPSGLIFFM